MALEMVAQLVQRGGEGVKNADRLAGNADVKFFAADVDGGSGSGLFKHGISCGCG